MSQLPQQEERDEDDRDGQQNVRLNDAAALLIARPLIVRALGVDGAERPRERATPPWLAALEGSVELVDAIFAYFANTISFVRIAAFAAVHAAVFVAVFALADTLARLHFGGPLSVAALVAGNIVMILLEGLTVTVQVLRRRSAIAKRGSRWSWKKGNGACSRWIRRPRGPMSCASPAKRSTACRISRSSCSCRLRWLPWPISCARTRRRQWRA